MIKITLLLLLFLLVEPGATAAELFGVPLQSATIDQLRTAAKEAGAILISESGESQPYDIYDSEKLLTGSSRLYLGQVGENRELSFAEYEFIGLKNTRMLQLLIRKYGEPETKKGKFITDVSYRWQKNGIQISLLSDWQNYRTRLHYVNPAVMQQMADERLATGQHESAHNSESY